jgi:hypothetical protein
MSDITLTNEQDLLNPFLQALITPAETQIAPTNGHLFKPGETRILIGLESFPEFNGQAVEIINIRKDGKYGRTYYVKGAINKYVNWVYEYRLA